LIDEFHSLHFGDLAMTERCGRFVTAFHVVDLFDLDLGPDWYLMCDWCKRF